MNSLVTKNRGTQNLSQASYVKNSNWLFEENKETKWSCEENKLFEDALALFDKDTPDRWYNVAAMIPGKTVRDVIKQYRELEDDISDIEAGLIPIPGYITTDSAFTLEWMNNQEFKQYYGPASKSTKNSDQERKKGVPWTEEEHRQFLLGLQKYGKGDWRNISRNYVTSRTPTQVASHAQKYYIRQLSGGKDKRRSSIHDITTVDTKSSSPEGTSLNHSTAVLQQPQQQLNMMVKAVYDLGMPNQEEKMAFDLLMSNGMKILQENNNNKIIGSYSKVFQMQFTQPR